MALRTAGGERRLSFQGCFNFRDVGGYRTTDGRRTRWRRLFRSDGLHGLTAAGRREVAGLSLASVIDLRTAAEVVEGGRAQVQAAQHNLAIADVLPCPWGDDGLHAEAALVGEHYYATLLASCEAVREVLAVLTDPSTYPAVVCCSSGVDRTGIVTAVVLGLVGVTDEVVVTDYAASREAMLRRIGRLRFEHPSAVRHDLDRYGSGLLGVLPEAMTMFLRRVRDEHGSFTGYAESIDMAGAVPYLRAALLDARR